MNIIDTEDSLEDATKSQIKMKNKMKDPVAIEKKQNVSTIDYHKLNALYEDFVPQKELSAEQKYFPPSFISPEDSTNESSMYSSFETQSTKKQMPSANPILTDTSSFRRPLNRDSSFKNSVVSNTKNSLKKVEVSDRTNKKPDVASKDVGLDTFITNDEIKNALIAKNVLCVSCAKNVLFPCHDNCLAKYKLNVHSSVRRALFTTPRIAKSTFKDTTPVVSKTRFFVRTVYSKFLDTTPVVSNAKIVTDTPLSAKIRLSHLNFGTINNLTKNDLVDGLLKFKYGKDHLCSICKRGKSKKASHLPKLVPSSHSMLELLHVYLCGPMRVASINGNKYILVIVDDYSRFTWVYFLRSKGEIPKIIKKFIAQVQLNYNAKIHKIRTDNGTEFKNATLKAHYEKLGIMQQFLIDRKPQKNGIVELNEASRTLDEGCLDARKQWLIFS
ncbi:retrovirus-related pol polyprotein from transposon TNT 1-94 [Tanacetum coccineum]